MSRTEQPKIRKLLLLEGLHGTGKSTLAASLAQQTRTATFHHGPPISTDPYYEYLRPMVFLESWQVIYDRTHLGEMVWPKLFGRESLFPSWEGEIRGVERAIREAARHVEVWYLVGPGSRDRIATSVQDVCLVRGLTNEQITTAHDLYLEALEKTSFETKVVSWSELDKEVDEWNSL